ncbi:MAG: hypothetical protein F4039_09255, partial [Gammaproteobacteria bacterium]|nr:hypothetical protein [Gammaproteobacteria bacterium]
QAKILQQLQDPYVRLAVRLQAAFGLRREEAMVCRFVCSRAFMNVVY